MNNDFKNSIIKDLSISNNLDERDVALIIKTYETWILKTIEENPNSVILVTNLGKFLVKQGRKDHWDRINAKRGTTHEEYMKEKKRIKNEHRDKTLQQHILPTRQEGETETDQSQSIS